MSLTLKKVIDKNRDFEEAVVPADDVVDSVELLVSNHSEELEVAAEEVVAIANSPNSIDRGIEFSANDVVHIANSPDSKDFEELVVSADEVVGIASSPDSIDEEIKQMERAAEIQESEPKISANIDDATSKLESFYLPQDLSVFFVNDQDFRFL